jgi:DnaJ-class molecular chaperone
MRALRIALLGLAYLLSVYAKSDDYYKILGVPRTATQQEIKKAFRGLSQKYHPDHNPEDPKANERFAKINNGISFDLPLAYEALSDPEKRKKYDKYGEDGLKEQGHGGGGDFDDLLSGFFGGGGGGR